MPSTVTPPLPLSLQQKLREIVGAGHVITDPDRLMVYESDGLTAYRWLPRGVVLPADTDEMSRVMALLHGAGVPMVPRGAGTGLSGGALAPEGAVVIGTARMNRILSLDALLLLFLDVDFFHALADPEAWRMHLIQPILLQRHVLELNDLTQEVEATFQSVRSRAVDL